MKKLKIKITNCHGIRSLSHDFDFNDKNFIIYARNGTMKSSLYKIFKEYKNNEESKDNFIASRISKREIHDENGNDYPKEDILLIGNEDFKFNNEYATKLLINQELKDKYDSIYSNLETIKNKINKSLKKITGVDLELFTKDLSIDKFSDLPKDFFDKKVIDEFGELKYKEIFNDESISILTDNNVIKEVGNYIDTMNDIINDEQYLVKNVFELNNLKNVDKSLKTNGYYEAKHELSLKNKTNDYTNYNQEQVEKFIDSIETKLYSDEKLKEINAALTAKVASVKFKNVISSNQWMIPYLSDFKNFTKIYWKYIINSNEDLASLIKEYISIYNDSKEDIENIIKLASSKENYKKWEEVTKNFNSFFINMPFRVYVNNIEDVILNEKVCSLRYEYIDGVDKNENVNEDLLKKHLSSGEYKAYNILNLMFEMEYRKENNKSTLLIIDDIADSFDYINKSAIIEYLSEIESNHNVKMIILSHNFDFVRSCGRRLKLKVFISDKGKVIKLKKFQGKGIGLKLFEKDMNEDINFISSIPFVRNIIEMTSGTKDSRYIKLTSMLHYKKDTEEIKLDDIAKIYNELFNKKIIKTDVKYIKFLLELADQISENKNEDLESKIVLSIATRVLLDKYMITKIDNWNIIEQFKGCQTGKMFEYCKEHELLSEPEVLLTQKILIVTSDNIHVNSFMYEPLIDLRNDELIFIYDEIKKLLN